MVHLNLPEDMSVKTSRECDQMTKMGSWVPTTLAAELFGDIDSTLAEKNTSCIGGGGSRKNLCCLRGGPGKKYGL